MKYFLIIVGLVFSVLFMPSGTSYGAKIGYALIKGTVKNSNSKSWDFAQTGFFNNTTVTVPIERNGEFLKKVKVEGDAMDLYLYLNNDAITIYIQENDTIEINWDANNFDKTFRVTSPNALRNQDLQTMLLLYKNYRQDHLNLRKALYQEKGADSVKFSMINNMYNKEMETLFSNQEQKTAGIAKMATDLYYKYTSLLFSSKLLPSYELTVHQNAEKYDQMKVVNSKKAYQILSEVAFRSSANYRKFLFDYIRFEKAINGWAVEGDGEEQKNKTVPFDPVSKDYYLGLANLGVYEIRDWYISSVIMFGFQYYSFDDTEKVYHDFKKEVKIKEFADSLEVFYDKVKRLKPGNIAPEIKLKNEKGKLVSLEDLKGKVVYIDFWGVGCGPCIYEIKNSFPELKEKYKNGEVVFMNICVDSNEKRWKKSLTDLKSEGVNLIAEGWTNHPVCQVYGIKGIPHYFLIDKDGKIANNNAPRPSEKSKLYGEIDALLEKK